MPAVFSKIDSLYGKKLLDYLARTPKQKVPFKDFFNNPFQDSHRLSDLHNSISDPHSSTKRRSSKWQARSVEDEETKGKSYNENSLLTGLKASRNCEYNIYKAIMGALKNSFSKLEIF